MTPLISLLFALAGLASLALAMPRHAAQAKLGALWVARAPWLRGCGWAALGFSLLVRLARPDWRTGLIEWIGEAGLAAAIVVVVLMRRPQLLRGLPAVVLLMVPIAALLLR
ncbi:DUF3325 domain-containing protein [Flavisphingomonas formosensis]|uniref:DUF3325 domain-containing protein n=1 Tax=Flavisphingomonas formosensis TaxID=861534 RepID=UPI0012F7122B|nr:DUF3325 domain-containing protein [Sphingomonas formosensis]